MKGSLGKTLPTVESVLKPKEIQCCMSESRLQ